MKCIISYMARKMWGGFVEGLPWCGFVVLFTVVGVGGIYTFKMIMEWLRVDPKLAGALIVLALAVVVIICSFVELYRKAKRHCATENEPACEHEFFQCQVPASDTCVPIYHWVCKKCHWDQAKGMFMPEGIWRGYAVPQLEEMRRAKC